MRVHNFLLFLFVHLLLKGTNERCIINQMKCFRHKVSNESFIAVMRFYATLFEKLKFYSIGIEWNNEFSCNTLHEMEKCYYYFFLLFSVGHFFMMFCVYISNSLFHCSSHCAHKQISLQQNVVFLLRMICN